MVAQIARGGHPEIPGHRNLGRPSRKAVGLLPFGHERGGFERLGLIAIVDQVSSSLSIQTGDVHMHSQPHRLRYTARRTQLYADVPGVPST